RYRKLQQLSFACDYLVRGTGRGARPNPVVRLFVPRGDRTLVEEEMMRTRVFLILLLAFLGVAGATHAQSFLGTIRGTVIDPQGAGVSDAAVLVVDESTGVPRAVGTDSQGRFEASSLRPGTYRIEVAAPNFKEYKQTGVILRAAGTVHIDVKLDLGARTETVTVTAEALNNITTD